MSVVGLSAALTVEVAAADAPAKPATSKPDMKRDLAEKPVAKPASTKPSVNKPEQPWTPGEKYRAHDMARPRPPVVSAPAPSADGRTAAPSDAIILFDGTNLDAWLTEGRDPKTKRPLATPAAWPIRDGYMEVPPRQGGARGSIVTREEFGSCQLHVEFATPAKVEGSGQGRGNSGIMLHGVCEVQVLDSFENGTYPDGQAAAIYSNYPPLVNASRKPGQWQTFDIFLELAKPAATSSATDSSTQAKPKPRPARITVLHNGVVVQHSEELKSTATKFKLALQDHNNPVRFRNIWIRPLTERE